MNKVEIGTKPTKQLTSNRLSKNISELISGGNKTNIESTQSDLLTHKMEIYFNMFGAGMKHRVGREISGAQIITRQDWRVGLKNTKLL